MCEAIEEMTQKRANRAYRRGEVNGEERGTLKAIQSIVKNLNVTAKKAMEILGLDAATQKKYLALL